MKSIQLYFDSLLQGSTPQAPLWDIERQRDQKPPRWNYIDGCMLKAVMDMAKATGNERYWQFAKGYIDFYIDDTGAILGYCEDEFNCDQINEGKVLFPLYEMTGDKKYLAAITRLHNQLLNQPRTPEGNFWHKLIYPNQIWLDGLYMVQPFAMAYQMQLGKMANYRDIIAQFDNVVTLMRDDKTGLYCHGYDAAREMFWCDPVTGRSPNVWGRSIGWFAMALIDTIELLDERFFDARMTLIGHFKNLMDSVKLVLDPDTSMVFQLPALPNTSGNYLETSATCALAYAYMKGSNLGALPAYDFLIGERMLRSVVEHKLTRKENAYMLKDICLVAGLGGMPGWGDYKVRDGSVAYYLSEPRVNNDAKGVAPMLFAYAQWLGRDQKIFESK